MAQLPTGSPLPGSEMIIVSGTPVPAASVELIVGESGLSLSGGEMIIWKRTVVLAAGKRYVSRASAATNEFNFNQWMARCPRAVGVRTDGSVQLPRIDDAGQNDPLDLLANCLVAVKRELGGQAFRGLAWALGTLAAGLALTVVFIVANMRRPKDFQGARAIVLGIVLVVGGILLGVRALNLLLRRQRVVGVVRGVIERGDLDPTLLAKVVATPAMQSGTNPATVRVGLVAATVSILSLCLMVCPFVGLALALLAMGLTFRQATWARTLAIIGLVLNVLFNAFVIFMMLSH